MLLVVDLFFCIKNELIGVLLSYNEEELIRLLS